MVMGAPASRHHAGSAALSIRKLAATGERGDQDAGDKPDP
jgi:hypothetical protein